jgi:inner membrane transporter RhtA
VDPDRRSTPTGAVALIVAGAASSQAGGGFAVRAFDGLGIPGVVAVRQVMAAVVLIPLGRPPLHRMGWAQWWPTLLLAASFALMNLSLYVAIDRIGLGLAVTLEFLGPLAIALGASRTRRDLALAGAAGVGVYVLVLPGASTDWVGLGLALVAAACWAGYIVLNRLLSTRLPGIQAPAAASAVAATVYLPVLAVLAVRGELAGGPLAEAAVAGVLSSAVPYATDLVALRQVSTRLFGVAQSLHPVLAALSGLVLLGEVPAGHEWIGIAVVAGVNAVAVRAAGSPS